jgi:hypothetical protein
MRLLEILRECSDKDLKRAYKSNKGYLFFDISIFNAGASIHIKCTDIFKEPNYNYWNGYDCIHENDFLMNEFISEVMQERGI